MSTDDCPSSYPKFRWQLELPTPDRLRENRYGFLRLAPCDRPDGVYRPQSCKTRGCKPCRCGWFRRLVRETHLAGLSQRRPLIPRPGPRGS